MPPPPTWRRHVAATPFELSGQALIDFDESQGRRDAGALAAPQRPQAPPSCSAATACTAVAPRLTPRRRAGAPQADHRRSHRRSTSAPLVRQAFRLERCCWSTSSVGRRGSTARHLLATLESRRAGPRGAGHRRRLRPRGGDGDGHPVGLDRQRDPGNHAPGLSRKILAKGAHRAVTLNRTAHVGQDLARRDQARR